MMLLEIKNARLNYFLFTGNFENFLGNFGGLLLVKKSSGVLEFLGEFLWKD